jgi:hypothetical protein
MRPYECLKGSQSAIKNLKKFLRLQNAFRCHKIAFRVREFAYVEIRDLKRRESACKNAKIFF